MVSWVGFRQIAVPYRRDARFAGETKYPLIKMVRFAADAIVSFSFTPLRLAVWTGFFALGVALAGIIYAIALRFFFDPSHWVRGWASLFVAVLFMGGVQLISLGIIGEYVGRIYGEVKQRPSTSCASVSDSTKSLRYASRARSNSDERRRYDVPGRVPAA
jgi:dolichol-phosphate mannosyltransferase